MNNAMVVVTSDAHAVVNRDTTLYTCTKLASVLASGAV